MENTDIAEKLEEIARLMELHGENPFKIKSYTNAAFKLDRLKEDLSNKSKEELEQIDGIGKSLSQKIFDLIHQNTFPDLDKLIAATPEGVIDMMSIKGIGPKKVALLWKELEIESVGELLYACNENRLIELKGFGKKTQDLVKQAIEFKLSQKGFFHFATAEKSANNFLRTLSLKNSSVTAEITGELRRKCEIVTNIEFLISDDFNEIVKSILHQLIEESYDSIIESDTHFTINSPTGIPIKINFCPAENFAYHLWLTTGNEQHVSACLAHFNRNTSELLTCNSEIEIYNKLGLPFIEPELREGLHEIQRAISGELPHKLVETSNLKGILHNHSTYSDGINTLEEMAIACMNSGFHYLGICDHSKSAQYAGGLSIERVKEQQEEIKKLNDKLAPFKIFSGIESDILADGSLDYPDEILKSFDFVVASVHSGLRMDEEKATNRILTAIRNPYTTILGHPSGRLLLSRKGYPLDYEKILKACKEHNVVVELNAHPYRLDLDWRWIEYATSLGLKISINPDAHSIEGYEDMYYGVCVARKGYLTEEQTFNAFSRDEIENWFKSRR